MAGAGKYPPFTPSKSEPDDETVEKALRGELKAATPRDTPKGPDRFGSHRSLIDSAFSSEPFGQTEDYKEPDYEKIARSRRVSTGGRDKNYLLFEAAREGEVENLELALRMGAKIDAYDPLGYTPLHMAAYHGNDAIVEFLVLHGANTDLETEVRISLSGRNEAPARTTVVAQQCLPKFYTSFRKNAFVVEMGGPDWVAGDIRPRAYALPFFHSQDGLTAYKLAMIEDEKKCAQIIRHRARDVKIAKRVHRRRASYAQALKELRLTAARKREKEESKKAVARKMLNLSRVASMMRKRTKEEAQTKYQIERERDSRRIAKFAAVWKGRAFGADASKLETSIVESDGKGARQRKIETVMKSAVEAFAQGIGGLGAIGGKKGKAAAASSAGAKLSSLVKKKLGKASGGGSGGGSAPSPAAALKAAIAPSTPAGAGTGTSAGAPASTRATAGKASPADPSATPAAVTASDSMGSLTTASAVRLAAQAAADTPSSRPSPAAASSTTTGTRADEYIMRKDSAPKQLAPLLDAAATPAAKGTTAQAAPPKEPAVAGTQLEDTPKGTGGPRRGGRRLVPSSSGPGAPTPPQGPKSTGSQSSAASGAGRSPRAGFNRSAGTASAGVEPKPPAAPVEKTPEEMMKAAGGEESVYGLDRVEADKERTGRKSRLKLATARILGMGKLWRRAFHSTHSDFAELLMGAIRAGTTEAAEQYGEEVVKTWLGAMGMGSYAEALLECGFNSMETISLLEVDDMGMVAEQLEELHDLWKAKKAADPSKAGPEPPRKMKPAHIKYILAAAQDLQEAMDTEELSNLALHTTNDDDDDDVDDVDDVDGGDESAVALGEDAAELAALLQEAEGTT